MKPFFLFRHASALVLGGAILCTGLRAEEPIDLGKGVSYLRIASANVAAPDLAKAVARAQALILDFRATADEAVASTSLSPLASLPAKSELYVLVSPDTPTAVADELAKANGKFVTLGIKDSNPQPQVVVLQPVADDRKARQSLAEGTAPAKLISGKIEKERFDEADLMKEFKAGNPDAHPPESAPGTSTKPAPFTDRVLQRAVQLHLARVALQRST